MGRQCMDDEERLIRKRRINVWKELFLRGRGVEKRVCLEGKEFESGGRSGIIPPLMGSVVMIDFERRIDHSSQALKRKVLRRVVIVFFYFSNPLPHVHLSRSRSLVYQQYKH